MTVDASCIDERLYLCSLQQKCYVLLDHSTSIDSYTTISAFKTGIFREIKKML